MVWLQLQKILEEMDYLDSSVEFQPWTQYRDDYGGAEIGSSRAWLFNLSIVFDTINWGIFLDQL